MSSYLRASAVKRSHLKRLVGRRRGSGLGEEGSALENGHFEVAKAYQRFSVNVRSEMMLRKEVEAIRTNLS